VHKIIALWAVPRSTSTAFEWMMRQRGDLHCMHEPFGEAWYQGEAPLWQRYKAGEKTTPGLTIESTWADIKALAEQGPVFIKDFPHYVSHMWDRDFLSHFTHAFLIRDPALTVTSMYDKWPDFDEGEEAPPVFDSSDLLENPSAMVSAFCESVGIPFIEDALHWKAGASTEQYSWWDGGSFHENLKSSTGLVAQQRRYVELDEAPERVRQVCRRLQHHYQRLHRHRFVLE